MAVHTASVGNVATRTSRMSVAGAAGITFAVTFAAGVLMVAPFDTGESNGKLLSDFHDARVASLVGAYLIVVAALAFSVMARALLARVADELSDVATTLAETGMRLFTTALLIGGAVAGAAAGSSLFGDTDLSADVIRGLSQAGYAVILLGAALSGALFVAIISRAAHRTGRLPAWLAIGGYVATAALILAVMFLPLALFALWALAIGVELVRHPDPEAG